MAADLHNHTIYSDGTLTPAQLLRWGVDLKLAYLGITDHDTDEGLEPARLAVEELRQKGFTPPELVPGVELSTEVQSRSVHLIAYWPELGEGPLAELLARMQRERVTRIERIVAKLGEEHIVVDLDRVRELAGPGVIGRPHVARALVEEGYASSVEEAFDLYLVRGQPGYVPRAKLDPASAAEAIHQAGGVCVLAHPRLVGDEGLVEELAASGILDGLEAWHPEHNATETQRYIDLAHRYRLVTTGGSDFHAQGEGSGRMGAATAPDEVVSQLWGRRKGR
ncbi:MAG: PHP domain-containing protein [Bacillota bacterium]|nr:PHP domain-containing protein [Bacillota bacterium]